MGHDRCFISIPLFHARDSYSLLSSSLPFPLSLSLSLIPSRSLFLPFSLYDACRHVWMRNCALARLKALCALFSSLTRRITENRYWIGLDTAGRREDETRRDETRRQGAFLPLVRWGRLYRRDANVPLHKSSSKSRTDSDRNSTSFEVEGKIRRRYKHRAIQQFNQDRIALVMET